MTDAPSLLAFSPAKLRARRDGWTAARQRGFIADLARHGCVSRAAAFVGMTARSAHRLKARVHAHGFRAAWDRAQALGFDARAAAAAPPPRRRRFGVFERRYQGRVVARWERVNEGHVARQLAHQRRRLAARGEAGPDRAAPFNGGRPFRRHWEDDGLDWPDDAADGDVTRSEKSGTFQEEWEAALAALDEAEIDGRAELAAAPVPPALAGGRNRPDCAGPGSNPVGRFSPRTARRARSRPCPPPPQPRSPP